MRTLKDIGLFLVPNVRGLMYLERFISNNVLPNSIIVQGPDFLTSSLRLYPKEFFVRYFHYFSLGKDLSFYQKKYDLNLIQLSNQDINSHELKSVVENSKEKYFLFSGGGIIKHDLLETGKHFI